MIVYLDTGVFVDFFSQRSTIAVTLRRESRRGRSVQKIQEDANSVMHLLQSHEPMTSVIAILEYKENTYNELKSSFKGLEDIRIENIMKNKSEAYAMFLRCQRNGIKLEPIHTGILQGALTNPEYDELEIDDAIHIETARNKGAKIVISTDSGLIRFDRAFDGIRIVDTDQALTLL
jgi:predicted nucleic acid-binding protein